MGASTWGMLAPTPGPDGVAAGQPARLPWGRHVVAALLVAAWVLSPGALVAQDTVPPPPTFILTGEVVDALNGRPVVSAVIKVPELRRYVFSDVNGRFRFTDFPEGTSEIVVEMLGYQTIDGTVTVSEGNGLVLQMRPDPVALEGFEVRTLADGLLYQRRRRYPYRVNTVSPQAIATAINPDPVVIFRRQSKDIIISCEDRDGAWMYGGCYFKRGGKARIVVFLDETRLLGGVNELSAVPAAQIHSMDWVREIGRLHVYTHWFIGRLNETRIGLAPFPVPMG